MPNDAETAPPDDWLQQSTANEDGRPSEWTVEEIHTQAESLTPDERLRLVVRLWKSLPKHHRAALVTLQIEDVQGNRDRSPLSFPGTSADQIDTIWPIVSGWLFDSSHVSDLYSAPRRFDLASIFVVTAAYSLLLGALSMFGAHPIIMVVFAALLAIIAAAQALFTIVANPRGVSIATGAIAYTLMSWIIWFESPHAFLFNSFLFVTFVNGIVAGGILGYLLGTLVGGVFLVADMLRGKFERRKKGSDTDDDATVGEQLPTKDAYQLPDRLL